MSVACGLPSGKDLASWIRMLPLAAGVDFNGLADDKKDNPLWVAQQVVQSDPKLRSPLHAEVAAHLLKLERAAVLTPALLSLARTPNAPSLVLTLNYDRLLEEAAARVKRDVVTLGVDDIPELLTDGLSEHDSALRVLHLHGNLGGTPDELVLDAAGYSRNARDDRVRELFQTLLAFYNLCIIGSSFEEDYLASVLLAMRPVRPRHVIVCDAPAADRVYAGKAPLTAQVHNVLVCDYPAGEHAVLDGFCEQLVECQAELATGPMIGQTSIDADPLYEPRRFVDLSERTEVGREDVEVSIAMGFLGTLDEAALREERRAVVVGTPGSGKTRLLEHLAQSPSAGERAILVRLRDVRQTVGAPASLLESWLAVGSVMDGGPPIRQTAPRDGSSRVHLLLDGLDELARDDRTRIAQAVISIGDAMPEQRLTLATRPTSVLELFPEDWRQLELLCDATWRSGLLKRVGLTEQSLEESLGPLLSQVSPLLKVPFFLRGMLDLLDAGRTPEDGLELVLGLLDRLLASDPLLSAIGPALDLWLQRVGATMLLSEATTIADGDLSQLAEDLQLGDPVFVADLLASRSLLLESTTARYAFQHRLFAEALVGKLLLEQEPEAWLDVLVPRAGEYSALREEWAGVAELLLPHSARWRAAVRGRDPLAAARSVPLNAPLPERSWAAEFLWNRAQGLEIWIHPGHAASTSDGEAVGRHLRAGGLATLEEQVRQDAAGGSRFQRGNALTVMADAGFPDAEAWLRRALVDDEDSVVRRLAASAARRLGLRSLVGPVERRALSPADDAEAVDLASVALVLTPPFERLELATRLLTAGNREVRDWIVLRELGTGAQIRWLATRARQPDQDSHWWMRKHVDEVVIALRRPTRRQSAQVAVIAAAARTRSEVVLDFLARHSSSAAVGLVDALDERIVQSYEIIELLLAVGSDALRRHGASKRVLEDVRAWENASTRRESVPVPLAPVTEERPRSLEDILDIQDAGERANWIVGNAQRLAEEAKDASVETRVRLIHELDALWGGEDLRTFVQVEGNRATIRRWAAAVLELGPSLNWPLSNTRWTQVALCGWLFDPQLEWLRRQAGAGAVRGALDQAPGPRSLRDLAELSEPEDLEALARAAEVLEAGPSSDDSAERVIRRLGAGRRPDLLAQLAATNPVFARLSDPELATSGDIDAQARELRRLIAQLADGKQVDRDASTWLDSVENPALFDLLAEAIPLAAEPRDGDDPSFDSVLAPLQSAIERAAPEASVALYDTFIADRRWPGAQFLVERRDRIVQGLVAPSGRGAARGMAQVLGLPWVQEA